MTAVRKEELRKRLIKEMFAPALQFSSSEEDVKSKPREGKNAIRFVNCWTGDLNIANLDSIEPSATTNYTLVIQGKWDLVLRHGEQWSSKEHEVSAAGQLVVHQHRGKHHCADCGRARKASQTVGRVCAASGCEHHLLHHGLFLHLHRPSGD